jgi:hypothetical protein
MPFQASECAGMMSAAQLLAHADPDNGMAWLTLAYAADESLADPEEIRSALKHASSASRVHDYGFDLMKVAVSATGEVHVPDDVRGQQTSDQFRLQFMNPFIAPASTITGWLKQGCNATNAIPPPAPKACADAHDLLRHGDSRETLSGDAEATAELDANQAASRPKDQAAYARAFIDAVAESSTEREWLGKMKSHLEGQ